MSYLSRVEADKRSKDPDDTEEAIYFYIDEWNSKLNLNNMEEYIKNYRGETLISFSTLAGAYIRCLPEYNGYNMPEFNRKRLQVIADSNNVSLEDKDIFQEFYDIYHTKANFIPFPPIAGNKKKDLNSVKGLQYNDFPDLFFKEIKLYYGSANYKEFLDIECNKIYLSNFNDWNDFVISNYLQDYFIDKEFSEFKQIKPLSSIPYKNKKMTEDEKMRYRKEIIKSISVACDIIRARANRF